MSQKSAGRRPSTGTLPPIAQSASPIVGLQRARSIDKAVKHIGQEQTYSRRLLDNEKQQIKARYERLKKKVSQIRSNLTPEQIAEIEKGSQQHEGGLAADGGTALASPRGRRISLEVSTAAFVGTPTPPVSPPPTTHRTRSAHQVVVVPQGMAMGHKRVHRLATSAKPEQGDGSSPHPNPLLTAQASHRKKTSAVDLPVPRQIPISPQSPDGPLAEKRTRAATMTCSTPLREQTLTLDILRRPRASTANGRLQYTPPKLPTYGDSKAVTLGPTPSSPPCCPERRLSSSVPNYRLSLRNVPLVGSPVQRIRPTRRISVHAINNVSSATIEKFNQWPAAASAEPPAAFSCHEPKLEDALSRSPPSKTPARRLSAVIGQVSPFQETRARKREELREARIGDNDHLSMELEHRKEQLLRGIDSIVGRPQRSDNDQLVTRCDDSPNFPVDGVLQNPVTENSEKRDNRKGQGAGFNWRTEMMKIRYLRLPKKCDEEICVDVPPKGVPQLKTVTKWRRFVRK